MSQLSPECLAELRSNALKHLMAEQEDSTASAEEIWSTKKTATALVVIVSVLIYAFYKLYHANLKKFPSCR